MGRKKHDRWVESFFSDVKFVKTNLLWHVICLLWHVIRFVMTCYLKPFYMQYWLKQEGSGLIKVRRVGSAASQELGKVLCPFVTSIVWSFCVEVSLLTLRQTLTCHVLTLFYCGEVTRCGCGILAIFRNSKSTLYLSVILAHWMLRIKFFFTFNF